MSLKPLVAVLGGDLYAGGFRANVPAPGHSKADRSVSLWLCGDRLLIHGFGAVGWQAVREDLERRGLIHADGRLTGLSGARNAGRAAPVRPDQIARMAAAEALWAGAGAITPATTSARHLALRGVASAGILNLAHHPAAPVDVYGGGRFTRPALVARISGADDQLTAVELAYLESNGQPALTLRLPRKTIGLAPPGTAVRLSTPAETLLVGEGVMTTLSAMRLFSLPGWALRTAGSLAAWSPPTGVRRVLIAGDRDVAGEAAAERLRRRLTALRIDVSVALPKPPFGDWNEVMRPKEVQPHTALEGEFDAFPFLGER